MGRETQSGKAGLLFVLTVCCAAGVVYGSMMMQQQATPAAKALAEFFTSKMSSVEEILFGNSTLSAGQWLNFGMQLLFPCAWVLFGSLLFSLWMIGQPGILLLYGLFGVECGCFGVLLLQQGHGMLLLFWYLPLVVLCHLALLPAGSQGLAFSLRLVRRRVSGSELRRQCLLVLWQGMWLLLICGAAVVSCRLFGSRLN